MIVNKIYFRLVVGVDFEDIKLLKYKLQYIKTLPIEDVFVLLHFKKGHNLVDFTTLIKDSNITNIKLWQAHRFIEENKIEQMNNLIGKLSEDVWILNNDCDEFPDFGENPGELIDNVCSSDADYLRGGIIDRLPIDNNIDKKLDSDVDLMSQFPVNANMHGLKDVPDTCAFIKGCHECLMPKVVMNKNKFSITNGHHHLNERTAKEYPVTIPVYHFKWFDGVRSRLCEIHHDVPTSKKNFLIKHVNNNSFEKAIF